MAVNSLCERYHIWESVNSNYWVFAVPYFGHDIMYPIVSGNPAPDGRRLDRADIIVEVSRGPESEGMG